MSDATKAKILIVEDESPLANAVNLKLNNAGYSVLRASDGLEAIQQVEDNPNIDVILLDLLLPNMDGFDVLKKIRETDNDVYIVVTSNLSQEEDKQKALDLGANDYLVKSDIQLSELVEYLDNLITAQYDKPEGYDQSN